MCSVCGKEVESYWVVFKDGTKCCDYLCSRKVSFDIREVVNLDDFSEPRPLIPSKKQSKGFEFKSETLRFKSLYSFLSFWIFSEKSSIKLIL